MGDVEIRTAGPDDVEAVVELWLRLVRDQYQYGTTLKADSNRTTARNWTAELIGRDGVIVAETDGAIVGFASLAVEVDRFSRTTTTGVIHNLMVSEDYRDQGIGSRLLAAAEATLISRDVNRVRLEVLADNEAAARFYRERGYRDHRIQFAKDVDETDTPNSPREEL